MPDEVGAQAQRSDAPSTDESLFGDTADDGAAQAVQEKSSTDAATDEPDGGEEETAQEEQGTGDADGQAAGEETEASEDLKVVVSVKGGRATIGVQRPSSDPHIETFDHLDVSGLTQEVPAVVERARARWEDAPKHPAYARPAPPARGRNRRGQGAVQVASTETSEGEAEQAQQQTLRLF